MYSVKVCPVHGIGLDARMAAFGLVWLAISTVYGEDTQPLKHSAAVSQDWPCWRGPCGDNHAAGPVAPLRWSVSQGNWRSAIPGKGHSSPCIVGNRVFLTSADESRELQFIVCLNRDTGQEQWQTVLSHGPLPTIHVNNSHASATPTCTHARVYAAGVTGDQLWLAAVNMAGELLWRKNIGRYRHANGFASSPVAYRDRIIVASENTSQPEIVALDCETGEFVWRTVRPASDNSATPIVAHVAGRDQLLINGAYGVTSYDPSTGIELWNVRHETEVVACTMAFGEKLVYASGKVPQAKMLCVSADGKGDVTDSHIVWKTDQAITYVPSPILVGDLLFVVTDSGVAYCRDAHTGEIVWKHRLGGDFFASPVFAGGNIYATAQSGSTYVFRAVRRYELVAKNEVGEPCMATPAICDGMIYLRTEHHLYCFANID